MWAMYMLEFLLQAYGLVGSWVHEYVWAFVVGLF